ncbi:hypothetical protein MUK42_35117 [Musa troglodytarum]|uniref:Uncharacterized protein n=1 Tax=Musa troglodytarum TaxID=320322 RepID=A0A9E7JUZ1_9LILI|nr:hypothetical protein MUK42_35117 [Musa troglodytarum]URD93405.1 hypothetical protein MUK42_35117 [Musa troglodytarum]URD93406.1 hypothetical protein MUK42_35117 [Musa troglodytarum]URD93407.1 hypothetical protein MUK42_35117 [Musa troglodytarum]
MTDKKESTSKDADIYALQKQWDEVLCPICMDHPHNAVVLLCTSYEKGCRSYICDTSYRHSNCLDRFRNLRMNSSDNPSGSSSTTFESVDAERPRLSSSYTSESASFPGAPRTGTNLELHDSYGTNGRISAGLAEYLGNNADGQAQDRHLASQAEANASFDGSDGGNEPEDNSLKCPLCRGTILGWMIVKEAREYMDQKLRSCSRESCSFSGNYKELRKHARRVHPMTRPAEVDPSRQRAWRRLENQQEHSDILSAIRSAMPGAIVFGDYVIDDADSLSGDGSGPWWPTLFLLHMIGSPIGSLDEQRRSSRAWRTRRRSSTHRHLWGENLLGLQDDDDWNSDNDVQAPRRRRRLMRSRRDEEQP